MLFRIFANNALSQPVLAADPSGPPASIIVFERLRLAQTGKGIAGAAGWMAGAACKVFHKQDAKSGVIRLDRVYIVN